MGGKNKKKNKNNVDPVQETEKNKDIEKKQQVQGPQADPVKQIPEPEPYNEQTKNSEIVDQKQEDPVTPSQSVTLTTETTEVQQQVVNQPVVNQPSVEINQQVPPHPQSQTQNTNQIAVSKEEEEKKTEEPQQKTEVEQIKTEEVPQTVEQKIQQSVQVKTEELNVASQEVKQQNNEEIKEVTTQAKTQAKTQQQNNQTIQQPTITQVQQTQQLLIQEPPIQSKVQANVNQIQQINQVQQVPTVNTDLIDGLKYVGLAAEEIIYHNPLQHEAEAHGQPSFTENFEPAAFHLVQRLQQEKLAGTPPKEELKIQDQPGLLQVQKQREEGLEQIRRSAESIDPDPLQLQQEIQQQKKVNILSSFHSQSQQDKARSKLQAPPSIEIKKSDHHIPIVPVTNPTYSNPLPTPEPQKQQLKISEPVKQTKQIDFDKINEKMLKERQVEWKKLQEKELQPKRPSFVMANKPNVPDVVEPVQPNRPEKLLYTNNLPLIDKQRTIQEHQKIKKEESEIKQKLQQSQKLKKQVNNDNPLKKLTVSILVTAACLGACVLGKADKKITAGVSIASLIVSYIAQK